MAATIISAFLLCLVVILPANLPCKAEPQPKPNVIRPFRRAPTNKPKPTLLPAESKNPEFYRKIQEEIPPKNEIAKKIITNLLRIRPGRKRSLRSEDMVFVLDGSESIGKCEFDNAKKALKNLLEYKERGVDAKYALVTFATTAKKGFDFLQPLEAKKKIGGIKFPNGGTNTQAGLAMAFDLFSKGTSLGLLSRKVVVLLTDGQSNIETTKTIPNANKLKNAGVEIFVIAFGNLHMSGINEMAHIATYPPYKYLFRVEKAGAFLDVVNLAIKKIAPNQYKILKKYKSSCPQ